MTRSQSEKMKNLKPFKKGRDSRRAVGGPVCIERMAWTNLFLNRLAKRLKPQLAADILATAYEARRSWAITEVHERLMGKITQPVGFQGEDGQVMNQLLVKVIHVKGPEIPGGNDGNGDDKK